MPQQRRRRSSSSRSSSRSGGSSGGRRARGSGGDGGLPPLVFAQASPVSVGGTSLFSAATEIDSETLPAFVSDERAHEAAVLRLEQAGFEILQISPTTINIAAPPATYERAFGTTLVAEERPVLKSGQREDTATFVECTDTDVPGLISPATAKGGLSEVLEGVAIEEPVYYHQNAFAPPKGYWHLRVPGDVSLGLNADRAHRGAITGRGVRVAMVDSGWFAHPFFTQRGYRTQPVVLGPGASAPDADENGHGTAESANVFAAAPDAELTMVKMNFANSIGAFNAAVALRPQIITCSWGQSIQNGPLSAANQALAAAVATAVARGIVVIFSAGNGHFGFPGQHPDVISAGGVFMEQDGRLRASDYSSGFASALYQGRNVPDVCGLVGMRPRAAYIMLPLQPGDAIDQDLAGGQHPAADETAPNDGWAAISGTSAAAPQLAGVCALVKQACPRLGAAEVRRILMSTARDVTAGTCHPAAGGHRARRGHDLATGAGLVDAHKAVLMAKVRCLQRPTPLEAAEAEAFDQPSPEGPAGPVWPIRPIRPPIRPPIEPPIRPIRPPVRPPIRPPVRPPIRPPIEPFESEAAAAEEQAAAAEQASAEAEAAGHASSGLTAEDVAALERLIVESDEDVGL